MLKELELTNFKAIRRGIFPLASLNLLTGLNGMGKSTVIQALLLLRQTFQEGMLDSRDPALILNGNLVKIGQGKDAYSQFGEEGFIDFAIREQSGVTANWSFVAFTQDTKIQELDVLPLSPRNSEIDPGIYSSHLFTDRFQYIPAERVAAMTAYPTSNLHVFKTRQFGDHARFAIHHLHALKETNIPIYGLRHPQTEPDDFSLLSNVRAWLSEVSPGIRISTYLHEMMDQVQLTFQYDAGPEHVLTNEFRPANVGFGISYVLPIIISVLTAKSGDLLMIENPESHLHPRGQSRMGVLCALAAQNGVQLIVETQSDHFLNGVRLSARNAYIEPRNVSIFFLEREAGSENHDARIISPQLDKNGKLSDWPDGFFDEWDKITFELI